MSLRPEAVHVKKAGAVDDVPPSEVLPGSLIEVRSSDLRLECHGQGQGRQRPPHASARPRQRHPEAL